MRRADLHGDGERQGEDTWPDAFVLLGASLDDEERLREEVIHAVSERRPVVFALRPGATLVPVRAPVNFQDDEE